MLWRFKYIRYAADEGDGRRFRPIRSSHARPGVLGKTLGEQWEVIEEGLPGRTTLHDDPIEGAHKNGMRCLLACLESHAPIDLVVLMLGTNDLKTRFSVNAADIGHSIAALLSVINRSPLGPGGVPPRALVLAPPPIREVASLGEIFIGGAIKSRFLSRGMAQAAHDSGAAFVDAAEIVSVCDLDGVHMEASQHAKLGEAVARKVTGMFG